jgi:hypothetical protein
MPRKMPAPSDVADKFMLRMPEGMRDRIAEEAAKNKRSMNAEIVARLEETFQADDRYSVKQIQGPFDAETTEALVREIKRVAELAMVRVVEDRQALVRIRDEEAFRKNDAERISKKEPKE